MCLSVNCSTDQFIYIHLVSFKISYPTPYTKPKINRAETYLSNLNTELWLEICLCKKCIENVLKQQIPCLGLFNEKGDHLIIGIALLRAFNGTDAHMFVNW